MKIISLLVKQLPNILTVAACSGVVATTILSANAGAKSHIDILTKELKNNLEDIEPLTVKEKVSMTWKNYIPTAISGVLTIGAIVGVRYVGWRREASLAALAASAGISDKLIDRYNYYISEYTSPETAAEIRSKAIQDVNDYYLNNDIHEPFLDADKRIECYEPYTDTIFTISQVELLNAEIQVNKLLAEKHHVWLGEWLEWLGIDEYPIEKDRMPWNIGWFIDDTFDWNNTFMGYYLSMDTRPTYIFDRPMLSVSLSMGPYEPDDPECWGYDTTTRFA